MIFVKSTIGKKLHYYYCCTELIFLGEFQSDEQKELIRRFFRIEDTEDDNVLLKTVLRFNINRKYNGKVIRIQTKKSLEELMRVSLNRREVYSLTSPDSCTLGLLKNNSVTQSIIQKVNISDIIDVDNVVKYFKNSIVINKINESFKLIKVV